MNDQDRANAFLKRLVKSVTPDKSKVWTSGIRNPNLTKTRQQQVATRLHERRLAQQESYHPIGNPAGHRLPVEEGLPEPHRINQRTQEIMFRRMTRPMDKRGRLGILNENEKRRMRDGRRADYIGGAGEDVPYYHVPRVAMADTGAPDHVFQLPHRTIRRVQGDYTP